MVDFEAPSFSLGLDDDLFDLEPQITPVSQDRDPSSSNQFSVPAITLDDDDDDFETLIVDDSEPEYSYSDSHPKLKRLRRGLTMGAPSKVKLHSRAVIDDEDIDVFSSHEDRRTDQDLHKQHHVVTTSSKFPPSKPGVLTYQPVKRKQNVSNACDLVSTSCNNLVFSDLTVSTLRRFQLIDSDFNSDDPSVNNAVQTNRNSHVTRNYSNLGESLPPAHHYFFHNDPRIQELVRSHLPNFSPLHNMLNKDLEQPSTSNIDYMGQFSCGGSSKQAARNIKDNKSSTSKKISRKSKTDKVTQGWVNPKLRVDKVTKIGGAKGKVHTSRQTTGHWLTGSDGKRVYVGKSGQELTGRYAYMQYKKESGAGFKKVKRKTATKKKKK